MTPEIRALIWLGGPDFEERVLDAPALRPGEALVRIDLATICGSDVHTVTGRRPGAHPGILGHEAVGHVAQVHPVAPRCVDGSAVAVGDRIVWSVTAACGDCDRCRAGRTAKCRHLLKTGHEPLDGPWPLSGGYATHLHLRAGLAVARVPRSVADGPAAMSACALATVMACLDLDTAGPIAGRRVLIVGAGMLGLGACAVAARRGAAQVHVLDPAAERAEAARRFGADTTSTVAPDAGAEGGVDLAVEMSGSLDGVRAALAALDVGGCAVLAGSVAPRGTVTLDPERVVRRHQKITGVHNYEPRHLAEAVDFLVGEGSGDPWTDVIAAPVTLAELPAALRRPSRHLRKSVAP